MRRYKISEAIGGISERHLEEAAEFTTKRDIRGKRAAFVKWISLAACICLMITGVYAAYDSGGFDLGISDDTNGSPDGSGDTSQGSDHGDGSIYGTALTLGEAVNAVHFKELFTFEGFRPSEITYRQGADSCEVSYRYAIDADITVRAIEHHSGDCSTDCFGGFDAHLYTLSESGQTERGYKYELYSCTENDSELKSEIAVIQYKSSEYDLVFYVKFDHYGEDEDRDVKLLIEQMKLIRFGN